MAKRQGLPGDSGPRAGGPGFLRAGLLVQLTKLVSSRPPLAIFPEGPALGGQAASAPAPADAHQALGRHVRQRVPDLPLGEGEAGLPGPLQQGLPAYGGSGLRGGVELPFDYLSYHQSILPIILSHKTCHTALSAALYAPVPLPYE